MVFDHLGVVVEDMEEGRAFLSKAFSVNRWTQVFEDPVIGVFVQFGIAANGPCYELVAPRGDASPVSVALRTRKAILNHVAYLVPDLDAAAEALMEEGCFPVGKAMPAVAYNQRRVQFFSSPLSFIIELIEAPDHDHVYAGDAPIE